MIEEAITADPVFRDNSSALGIEGTKNQPPYPGVHQQGCAHGARFQGHVDGDTGQTIVFYNAGRLTQGSHFGMAGGVGSIDTIIARLGQDRPTDIDHHRPYRHLACSGG